MNYKSRIKLVQEFLNSIADALLIENKTDLFYLTGLELSAGKLLIHHKGAHLFVDRRYYETCIQNCPFPVLVIDPPSFESQFLLDFSYIHTLAFDSNQTSYANTQQLVKQFPAIQLCPVQSPILQQRMIKEDAEIEKLKNAAILGSEGFDYICTLLKEGITEKEIARELEIFWKQRNSKGLSFDPIIAFGVNSSKPHHRASSSILAPNDIVLIDIGVNHQHYHSDMTRTFFFGTPDPKLAIIHEIVKKAQEAALRSCFPGNSIGNVDKAARNLIADHGYGDKFTHSLGHGVGLDIHELPRVRKGSPDCDVLLKPGMVITIEPGIYLEGLGGVRLEDTIVITENGYENLTRTPISSISPCKHIF